MSEENQATEATEVSEQGVKNPRGANLTLATMDEIAFFGEETSSESVEETAVEQEAFAGEDTTMVVEQTMESPLVDTETPVKISTKDTTFAEESFEVQAERWLNKEGNKINNETAERFHAHYRSKALVLMGEVVNEWSKEEVLHYIRTSEHPKKSSGGFYLNSPVRASKIAQEWSKEELVGFFKGELKATRKASEEALINAAIVKWDLTPRWSERDIRNFILEGKKPAVNKDGVMVHDQLRRLKPAAHWNRKELKAWARGEIRSTKVATEADLIRSIKALYQLSEELSKELVIELLSNLKEEPATMAEIVIQHNLETYAREMAPGKPVTDQQAATYQQLLYSTLNRILKMEGTEFVEHWTMLLDFVHTRRATLFHELRAYRGVSSLTLSARDCRNFEQMMNLLLKTCDPSVRYASSSVLNYDVVLGEIASEEVRQKLLAYYRIGQ